MLVQAVSAVVTTNRAKKYQARLTGTLLTGRFRWHGPANAAPSVVPIQCKELDVWKTIKMARVPWVRSYQRLARESTSRTITKATPARSAPRTPTLRALRQETDDR